MVLYLLTVLRHSRVVNAATVRCCKQSTTVAIGNTHRILVSVTAGML